MGARAFTWKWFIKNRENGSCKRGSKLQIKVQTRKQTAEESGQASPPVLTASSGHQVLDVVVINREKRSRLPPILGWMDTCRIFVKKENSSLILFSSAFHCIEPHMLIIRSMASKWQWCLLKQLSDELFHMNYVNMMQSPWDNFIVAKSGPSAQQKLPCGRKLNSWSKSGSLAVALIFPVVQNNEQLRNV